MRRERLAKQVEQMQLGWRDRSATAAAFDQQQTALDEALGALRARFWRLVDVNAAGYEHAGGGAVLLAAFDHIFHPLEAELHALPALVGDVEAAVPDEGCSPMPVGSAGAFCVKVRVARASSGPPCSRRAHRSLHRVRITAHTRVALTTRVARGGADTG